MLEKTLFSTTRQKVLGFLIQNPDREYFDREISKLTGISKSGTNLALRELTREGLILRQRRGRMYFYKTRPDHVVIRHMKILQNIVSLDPLIKKLQGLTLRIILYGSAAKGENTGDSDIDLFIMTRSPKDVQKVLFKHGLREKLQCVIHTPSSFVKSKKANPAFYNEVERGIVLWQEK